MASKPYPQTEETPCTVNEPVVAYQPARGNCVSNYKPSSFEKDKLAAEWLRPHTIEELHAICDEAEADDEADRLLGCDFVHAEMERLNPWLCK